MFLTSFGGQLPGRQLPNHFYPIVIPISVQWNNHIIAKFYIWCCRFKLQQKNNIFIFVHFNSSSSVSWFFGKIRFVWAFGFFKHWCHSAISISKNNYFLITLQKLFSISRLKMIVCEHFPMKKIYLLLHSYHSPTHSRHYTNLLHYLGDILRMCLLDDPHS